MLEIFLFLLVGVFSGTTAGLLGVGGGLIFLPLAKIYFIDYLAYPPAFIKILIATSTAIIVVNSASATVHHYRKKNTDVTLLPYFIIACILGAKLGVLLIDMVPATVLKCILATFLTISAIRILSGKKLSEHSKMLSRKSKFQIGAVSILISTLSSMLGLGGGALMGPVLNGVFGQSIKKAIGTASMFTFTVSATACLYYLFRQPPNIAIEHFLVGYVDVQIALFVAIGGIFGSWMGARLLHHAPVEIIQKIFAVLLLIGAVKMWM